MSAVVTECLLSLRNVVRPSLRSQTSYVMCAECSTIRLVVKVACRLQCMVTIHCCSHCTVYIVHEWVQCLQSSAVINAGKITLYACSSCVLFWEDRIASNGQLFSHVLYKFLHMYVRGILQSKGF